MQGWCIADLVRHTQGTLLQGEAQQQVQGFSTDSRTVQDGDVFIALRGERFDGHQFLPTAVAQGAVAVIVAEPIALPSALRSPSGATPAVIRVVDTERALQELALAHRQHFTGTVVAITGSNGKTTVKEMTARVLAVAFATYKAPGNLNNHIGVPLALLGLPLSVRAAVFELGMNHLGEIRRLRALTLPHIGVITNIGLAHVGYLGSITQIQQAKGELLEGLDASGVAIVNADDPRTLALGQKAPGRVLTFGQDAAADVRGWLLEDQGLQGIRCALSLQGRVWELNLQVPGKHQLLNALAALAVGVAMQVPTERMVTALQRYRGIYGRLTVRHGRHETVVLDDTYNANPHSMQVALQCLAQTSGAGQRVAVLGDMLELGDAGPALHQEVGTWVAQTAVDRLITLGPLATCIADGAQQAGLAAARIHRVTSQQEALAVLASVLRPHDIVLLKGSRGMALEHLVQALITDEGEQ
jgi:UDP-N-acetylmuramoyl-tripeptide--D-alanyl-D-alanine ligase